MRLAAKRRLNPASSVVDSPMLWMRILSVDDVVVWLLLLLMSEVMSLCLRFPMRVSVAVSIAAVVCVMLVVVFVVLVVLIRRGSHLSDGWNDDDDSSDDDGSTGERKGCNDSDSGGSDVWLFTFVLLAVA
jgi:Mg2+/Co2+ transporter CorB